MLTADTIKYGARLVRWLERQGLHVSNASWCRIPESGCWKLVIESPLVDTQGPIAGYKLVQRGIASSGRSTPLSLTDVCLFGLIGEIFQYWAGNHDTHPVRVRRIGRSGARRVAA